MLYKNKYRVESCRLRNWDYSSNGYYYITLCTSNRIYYFGNIVNKKMILSKIGYMAHKYWQEIPNHFPFVQLDQYVIMPNHIHGIIIINKHKKKPRNHIRLPVGDPVRDVVEDPVETQYIASQRLYIEAKDKFGPQSKNIGSIIRGFKIGVTMETKSNNISFKWQPRFYDHIIRNSKDLGRIRKYIKNNPQAWKK